MNDITKKIVKIAGTQAIKNKAGEMLGLKILDDKDVEYTMWFTKKDGKPTRAAEMFKEQQLAIGSEVGIAFAIDERTYTYEDKKTKEMKTGKGVNRTIRWFSTPETMDEYLGQRTIEAGFKQSAREEESEQDDQTDISNIPF